VADIEPAVPRNPQTANTFSIGCFALVTAVLIAIAGVVLVTSGQFPAALLIPAAVALGYWGSKKLKKVDSKLR
jgi:hypothetical protein